MPATGPAPQVAGSEAPKQGSVTIPITVWSGQEADGQWFALALDFDIASMGASEEAALNELEEMVLDYLRLGINEGRSIAELRRGVPRIERAKLYGKEFVARIAGLARAASRRDNGHAEHAHRRKLFVPYERHA